MTPGAGAGAGATGAAAGDDGAGAGASRSADGADEPAPVGAQTTSRRRCTAEGGAQPEGGGARNRIRTRPIGAVAGSMARLYGGRERPT